jgi:hypothetical protein
LLTADPSHRSAPAPELDLSIPVNFGMTTPASAPGAIAGSVLPLRRAEELIATLPGVISVRIIPGDSGAIEEVHVLTTDQVAPKNTVRNIESAQLGLRINHRKVSIATTLDAPRALDSVVESVTPVGLSAIPGGAAAPAVPFSVPVAPVMPASQTPPAGAFSGTYAEALAGSATQAVPPAGSGGAVAGAFGAVGRTRSSLSSVAAPEAGTGRRLLIFEDVEVRRSRSRGVLCRVTLSRAGQEYVGEAEGQETERSRIELAARATLQAIGSAVQSSAGGERSLSLEGAKLIDAFDREFVFVSVSARVGREPVCLSGSCEVRESAETSAVLSVLDATNRWVQLDR